MKNILIILFILILILFGLSWYMNKDKAVSKVILTISLPDQKKIEISSLPENEMLMITTGKGETQQVLPVSLLLKTDQKWNEMTVISKDNAQLKIDREELDKLYLAVLTDDEGLYLRLIIPTDDFHQRWLKYVTKIELK